MKKLKKFKQFTAVVSACALMVSSVALPASAFYDTLYIGNLDFSYGEPSVSNPPLSEGPYGTATVLQTNEWAELFVITDSTGLEEMEIDLSGQATPSVDIYKIREFVMKRKDVWSNVQYTNLDEESAALVKSYGPDARYYQVFVTRYSLSKFEDERVALAEIGKNFMNTHPSVQAAFISKNESTQKGRIWTGKLLGGKYITSVVGEKVFGEFGGDYDAYIEDLEKRWDTNETVLAAEEQYRTWQEQIDQWRRNVNLDALSPEEIYLSRLENNIPTDYEMMSYAYDAAQKLADEFPEYTYIQLGYDDSPLYKDLREKDLLEENDLQSESHTTLISVLDELPPELSYSPVIPSESTAFWTKLGDVDKDGEINASDAAALLQYSASSGAGISSSANVDVSAMDVNGDKLVNAVDASLILQYSAAKGSGFSGSFTDFLDQ